MRTTVSWLHEYSRTLQPSENYLQVVFLGWRFIYHRYYTHRRTEKHNQRLETTMTAIYEATEKDKMTRTSMHRNKPNDSPSSQQISITAIFGALSTE